MTEIIERRRTPRIDIHADETVRLELRHRVQLLDISQSGALLGTEAKDAMRPGRARRGAVQRRGQRQASSHEKPAQGAGRHGDPVRRHGRPEPPESRSVPEAGEGLNTESREVGCVGVAEDVRMNGSRVSSGADR